MRTIFNQCYWPVVHFYQGKIWFVVIKTDKSACPNVTDCKKDIDIVGRCVLA